MPEASESALEAKEKDRAVALIIAILALLLALGEAGSKRAQHISTEKNIEASDVYNFYQAKRIRATVVETAGEILEAQKAAFSDPAVQGAVEQKIADFKTTVARFEKDPKKPADSLDALQERADEAVAERDLANHRLERYEFGTGLIQIAIVLASAAIITSISLLIWLSIGFGVIGSGLIALGFLAPTALNFLG